MKKVIFFLGIMLVVFSTCKKDIEKPKNPVADFTVSKTSITKGETIQFTDKSTNTPTSWLWTFGDGTTSAAQNPSKTYSTAGTYTVSLKVSNSFGSNTKTVTNYITVSEPGLGGTGPIEMVTVPGGTFQMGSTTGYSNEQPVHSVTLSSFKIGKTEVTQAQWKAVMGSNPSYFIGDDLPVEWVSWNNVQVFLQKLNQQTGLSYRMPTEAEWEFAARGGGSAGSPTEYSGSNTIDEVAWYSSNSGSNTHPVGQKKANELGLYDMSGSVWEWCADWFGGYSSTAQTNPTGPATGSGRVRRGGGWYNIADSCRVANRNYNTPPGSRGFIGFRVALSL